MPNKNLPTKPPLRALWETTWKCDLRCDHCLVQGGDGLKNELSTQESLDLVDQVADLGVKIVSLTGGEPFLRKDWELVAGRIRERGMRLRFAANGHLLTDKILCRLLELKTEMVAVSLDGTRETHDKLRHSSTAKRTNSSFDTVTAALDKLADTEISVQVITTVMKSNLNQLPDIHSHLKRHGVQSWSLQLAHPTGRLTKTQEGGIAAPILPEQLPQLADFIVKNSKDPLLQPSAFNSVGYLSREEPILRASGKKARHPIWQGCQCGISTVGIEPDGGIKGCANQVGEPFVVGNIREEPLKHIWEDRSRWHWLSPAPEQFSAECGKCPLARVCHGGCTVMAYRTTGELFNNPYCLRALERKAKGSNE